MPLPPPLTRRPCFLHSKREAAAMCMGCSHSFCRECISEHDLRMLCADCLRRETDSSKSQGKKRRKLPTAPLQLAVGLLVLWFTVYLLGSILSSIPADFHDGIFDLDELEAQAP